MFRKNKKKNLYKPISTKTIEEELNRINYKNKYNGVLRNTLYTIIIIAAASAIIATLIMPVLQISGSSMEPLYSNGDIVVSFKTKNLSSGDIIAFYHGNKILIKRVVAKSGEWVNIDKNGNVYVNGKMLEEDYLSVKDKGDSDIEFPYQVPDGSYFVLSDDRFDSIDSRNEDIGSIKKDDLVGKILFKVWPLK